MTRYEVSLDWFNEDPETVEVEAETLDEAARKVWDEWHRTGWTDASVREAGRTISLDLDANSYEEAVWDSDNPTPN